MISYNTQNTDKICEFMYYIKTLCVSVFVWGLNFLFLYFLNNRSIIFASPSRLIQEENV